MISGAQGLLSPPPPRVIFLPFATVEICVYLDETLASDVGSMDLFELFLEQSQRQATRIWGGDCHKAHPVWAVQYDTTMNNVMNVA